jgi:hypothetical protein
MSMKYDNVPPIQLSLGPDLLFFLPILDIRFSCIYTSSCRLYGYTTFQT